MDGLTTAFVCSVPVTPGVPVVIKVTVADASNAIYDSAVALLDGGIWSERSTVGGVGMSRKPRPRDMPTYDRPSRPGC